MDESGDELGPELLTRLVAGDREAFERLVQCYERPVFNLACRMLGNATEAADATQSVFLKVFEHLDGYDPKYRLFSWIYRIAVNVSIDRLEQRKRTSAGEVPIEDELLDSGEQEPEEQAEASQIHDLIQVALMELQTDYRAVILLRHFSGCSYGEIAEILGIPEKTVKSRLHDARQHLRKRLCSRGVVSA
ncbi:MAG TPA: sigma-70 family RNA polymerase sigma factor [Rhodanobacteraceae bacterium]|nr:sigma-70 family RNA polymerase sigma factor [Rhodanobacteraceae bacterium]